MNPVTSHEIRHQLADRRLRLDAAIQRSEDPSDLVSLLREVDDALARIDGGTYGGCEVCRGSVDDEFLLANPLIQYCLCGLSEEQQDALGRDLGMAARIQWALLPPQDLAFGGWQTHFRYQPAGPVSGDYCHLLSRSNGNGQLHFAVGDVSGKGVAASLLMAHLNAAFRSLIEMDTEIPQLLGKANELLAGSTIRSHYATMLCGSAGPAGKIRLGNAGHCLPLVVRSSGVEVVECSESTGLPMGILGGQEYPTHDLQLQPGESLLLYTDGLTEARDPGDREYGAERLIRVLAERRNEPPSSLASAVLHDLTAFRDGSPASDDTTLLILRRE